MHDQFLLLMNSMILYIANNMNQTQEQSDQGSYCLIPLKEGLPLVCVFWLLEGIQSIYSQQIMETWGRPQFIG